MPAAAAAEAEVEAFNHGLRDELPDDHVLEERLRAQCQQRRTGAQHHNVIGTKFVQQLAHCEMVVSGGRSVPGCNTSCGGGSNDTTTTGTTTISACLRVAARST